MQKKQALEGINILDFSWVITGPLATKWMGDCGATVVRVESQSKLDVFRGFTPMAGGIPGVDRCAIFAHFNSSKYDITLNLNHPRSIEVVKQMVDWSDVVVENFIPGTMENWGLGYDALKEIKADVIMVRASMYGETGPLAKQPGFGAMMQASAGFAYTLGWPDRGPTVPGNPYTDTISAAYVTLAILSALDYRRRTGKGQCLDLSQFEAGISLLSPMILDYNANARLSPPQGNRCAYAAPHGVYPCRGDDRWCAIAVFNDVEWEAFSSVLGNPEWTKREEFASFLSRKQNEDELDKLVAEWSSNFTAGEVMDRMQAAGVTAGVVQTGQDLLEDDAQLKHRHHFRQLDHPEIGPHWGEAPPFELPKTPPQLQRCPLLGEHTEYVCREFLRMSDQEFVELLAEGVFE